MRYAVRQLLRTPSFTAIAVLTLALGIGGVTAIFAIVDELAFKPARSTTHKDVYHLGSIQIPDFETLVADRPPGVEAIAAFDTFGGGLAQIPGRAGRVNGWRVSGGYAQVHDIRAQLGRWINEDDNVGGELDPKVASGELVRGRLGADVVVISDTIWKQWFGASPDVVLRGSLNIDRRPMQIIGVAPAGFQPSVHLWTPFGQRRLLTREELDRPARRLSPFDRRPVQKAEHPRIQTVVRTAPNGAVSEINDKLSAAVASRQATVELPISRIRLNPPSSGNDRQLRTGYVILGFAALIFIAACANLGNMLFARATDREGELAVRLSLGATRSAIFGLLVSETVVICAAASGVGLLLATVSLRMFADAFPAFQLSSWQQVTLDLSPDWRIFAFATGAGAVAAVIIGAGSLWRSDRASLLARLAASSAAVVAKPEVRALRTMLVSVQITAAVLLLIATGMLLENSSNRLNRRLLFDTKTMVAASVQLPAEYDASRGAHFFSQLLERVRRIDGVSAAGLADALPGGEAPSPRHGLSSIVAETPARGLSGNPNRLDGQWIHISPALIETLGLPIARGRDFRETDIAGSDPVVLVSESTARGLWRNEDPLGKRLRCCGAAYFRQVVGVVPDPMALRDRPLSLDLGEALSEAAAGSGPGVFVFLPAAQHDQRSMLVVARSNAPRAAGQPIRNAVAALDPEVPVFAAGPVDAIQFPRTSAERSVRLLAGTLGAIALGIAVLGVYAVVSYFVSRRRREFGLRLALGSTRGQIVKLVVDHSIHMVLIGLLPGVLLASWGTRVLQVELVRLHPNGLRVWIAVPLLMLVAGIVAAYIPARRAARVDPNRALKDN